MASSPLVQRESDERPMRRKWAVLSWLWLALVLLLAAHQFVFWRAPMVDDNVMALLPGRVSDPIEAIVDHRMFDGMAREIVVLVGGDDWPAASRAAAAFTDQLRGSAVLAPVSDEESGAQAAVEFFQPFRDRLLTGEQRRRLAAGNLDEWTDTALAQLYGPGVAGGLGSWHSDPLRLWPDWWQERLGRDVSIRDGMPAVSRDGSDWIILRLAASTPAFQLDGRAHLKDALDAAAAAARRASPGARILRAGVPLHAEAAAVRASWEVNTIGLGSLLAVVVLMWLAFRSPLPVALVALSLLVGCAAAVSVTVLVFGKIHLLTLVFGASLVGVAEDYGIHYFASRQGHADMSPHRLMKYLLPGLFLAMVTSALAYLGVGLAPLPGLQQMAVFSVTGLLAAFATVVAWFPWLDRGSRPISQFGRRIGASLAGWPRINFGSTASWAGAVVLALFCALGIARLQTRDDLRSLQNSPLDLVTQQQQVSRLLGLPSPAQYFLLVARSEEDLLQREEALRARLDPMVASGKLSGYSATSDWVPSLRRQAGNARLTRAVESAVLDRASDVVGEPIIRPEFSPAPLRVADWMRAPVSQPFRSRWLGEVAGNWASVVMLDGIGPGSDLARLREQANGLPGVRWVDRTSEISALLGHYRQKMQRLLVAGFFAVWVALWWRYRKPAWRAVAPTALAVVLTMSILGWLGEPFQLFTVLALLLLLGMGVDYGIFLLEHRDDGASWLAVSLGAGSTLLAFGLLALSQTPALHSFGLSLLLGISLVWLLSPCFRPKAFRNEGAT